jgi:succinate dehydrogenase / fumarate reductase membrane anchor subunit
MFRSPLARAMGSGSAKQGSRHWLAERVSALALVPLTIWFVASVIVHTRSGYTDVISWLKMPFTTICTILLLLATFHHAALGLQVVIEDYLHSGTRFVAEVAVRLGCYGLAVTGIVAALSIAFGR